MITDNYRIIPGEPTVIRCRTCNQSQTYCGTGEVLEAKLAGFKADHDKAHEKPCPVVEAERKNHARTNGLLNTLDLVYN